MDNITASTAPEEVQRTEPAFQSLVISIRGRDLFEQQEHVSFFNHVQEHIARDHSQEQKDAPVLELIEVSAPLGTPESAEDSKDDTQQGKGLTAFGYDALVEALKERAYMSLVNGLAGKPTRKVFLRQPDMLRHATSLFNDVIQSQRVFKEHVNQALHLETQALEQDAMTDTTIEESWKSAAQSYRQMVASLTSVKHWSAEHDIASGTEEFFSDYTKLVDGEAQELSELYQKYGV